MRVSGPPIGVVGVMLQAVPLVHTTLVGAVYVPAGHPSARYGELGCLLHSH